MQSRLWTTKLTLLSLALATLLLLALCSLAVRAVEADWLADRPRIQSLQRAAKLVPDNAEYRLRLGHDYEFNLEDLDTAKAEREIRRAAALEPYSGAAWAELAAVLGLQGNLSATRGALQQAVFQAPHSPQIAWVAGNTFLLAGQTTDALRQFRVAIEGDNALAEPIFNLTWKASGNGEEILREVIPPDTDTELAYLYFLTGRQDFTEALRVWSRLITSSRPFSVSSVAPFVDQLIGAQRIEQAHNVWRDLGSRSLVSSHLAARTGNLVNDGDFEEDPVNIAFQWRILPCNGARGSLDASAYVSPRNAGHIRFDGTENVNYMHFYQFVPVVPGQRYRFKGFMKTVDITTDSGPRFEIVDWRDMQILDVLAPDVIGSTGWTSQTLEFVAKPKEDFVMVRVARRPSTKLDNKISGQVWFDNLTLTPLSQSQEVESPKSSSAQKPGDPRVALEG